MIDVVSNKMNFRHYKASESYGNQNNSLKNLPGDDDEDNEPVVDPQTAARRDSYKVSTPTNGYRASRGLAKSSSWDYSAQSESTQRYWRMHRANSFESMRKTCIRDNNSFKMRESYDPRIDSMKKSNELDKEKRRFSNPPERNSGTLNSAEKRKSWLSFERIKSMKTKGLSSPDKVNKKSGSSQSPTKKSSAKSEGPFRAPSGKRVNFLEGLDHGDQKFQKMEDESIVLIDSGKNSLNLFCKGNKVLGPGNSEAEVGGKTYPNNEEGVAKQKMLRASKTVLYEKFNSHNDAAPQIMMDIGNQISTKLEQRPKSIAPLSPDNSMNKDEGGILKLRYDRNFFNKHIENRTGVPTILAKKREATGILYYNNIDKKELGRASDLNANSEQMDKGKTMNVSLLKELASIEKQKYIKMQMEQFVLLFNKKAEQGINYLINSNLVEDNPEKIAHALLVTEGLNKEVIGDYLGSHKEQNRKVLKAYCQLLDFRKLEFDHALRLLLSRFKLPGEAQQIERIVNVFATVYHNDNSTVFADEDTPFILAYSLLMLNTDAHSDMVANKNKMTRHQFIENNIRICKTLTKEYLGRMYDNIVKQKFETKADYIETIYNRLHQGHINIHGESLKNLFNLAKELMSGAKFIKYGRKGKSHERRVWISEKEDAILWSGPSEKVEKSRVIPFSEIRDVSVGHNSTPVLIKNKVPSEFDSLIFSIISTKRTLDLKAPDMETRVKWERYFRLFLLQRKDKSKGMVNRMVQRRAAEKEKLSEIWKVDILPNWESHWDYENRKPKNLNLLFAAKNSRKSVKAPPRKSNNARSSSVWSFFRRKKKSSKKYEKALNENQEDSQDLKVDEEGNEDEDSELNQLFKNKSMLLVSLWKRGIPDWLRSILWPISIGNQLEITENLYEILLSQAKVCLKDASMSKSTMFDSLKSKEVDLEESLKAFPDVKERKAALVNILDAFIFYRPDVGYVKGMSRLVIVLLFYCSEYQAFSCFINLTHSHHFIPFFRGIMREIEWRLRFFNKVFEEEIPQLYNHFKALDLSSEMFLLEWFLSLFATAMSDIEIISRIWDSFLLEGEVYAIKTAVAILKYFELDLKVLTFDGAIKFLKELPNDIDEDLLFSMIERVDVSWKDYQDELEAQKVAEINSKVHQALLEN